MSRKRILSLLLSAAMLATLLAGCGGQGTSDAAGSAQSQPGGEKTQVVLWHTYTAVSYTHLDVYKRQR